MKFVCIILILALAFSQTVDNDGIMILDSNSFHKVVKNAHNLLLFFHSAVRFILQK